MNNLTLVCGLPGSGKTTVAKRLEIERRAIRMCPDEWIECILEDPEDTRERDRLRDPVENLQWELAQDYLRKGLSVILENGFWAEEERSLYAVGALALGARIELVYVEAPDFEQLWKRVEHRNGHLVRSTFILSKSDLMESWNLFHPPTQEEMSFYDDGEVIPWAD